MKFVIWIKVSCVSFDILGQKINTLHFRGERGHILGEKQETSEIQFVNSTFQWKKTLTSVIKMVNLIIRKINDTFSKSSIYYFGERKYTFPRLNPEI